MKKDNLNSRCMTFSETEVSLLGREVNDCDCRSCGIIYALEESENGIDIFIESRNLIGMTKNYKVNESIICDIGGTKIVLSITKSEFLKTCKSSFGSFERSVSGFDKNYPSTYFIL